MENEYHRPRTFPDLGQELTFYGHCVQTRCPSFVQTTPNLQTQKTLQKPVDKRREKCYNMQAVWQLGCQRAGNRDGNREKEITKKVEKTFEKPLDKRKEM